MSSVAPVVLHSVAHVQAVVLPSHSRDDGTVVVAEGQVNVPFTIARVFTLQATVGAQRGKHAHRLCSQFILCVAGTVDVICDDGLAQKTFTLDRVDRAVWVPPTIWNTLTFRKPDFIVVVLCDRLYEAHDYIRDYSEFIAYRKAN